MSKIVNILLKNGLFIEMLFKLSFLWIIGNKVFSKIISVVIIKKILFN